MIPLAPNQAQATARQSFLPSQASHNRLRVCATFAVLSASTKPNKSSSRRERERERARARERFAGASQHPCRPSRPSRRRPPTTSTRTRPCCRCCGCNHLSPLRCSQCHCQPSAPRPARPPAALIHTTQPLRVPLLPFLSTPRLLFGSAFRRASTLWSISFPRPELRRRFALRLGGFQSYL